MSCTIMENNILDSLNLLGCQGPLNDQEAFSKALEGGPKSLEFTKLIHILTEELKTFCHLEVAVSVINSPDDSTSFLVELNSFLKKLNCPYKCLVTEDMSSCLQSKEDCLLLLDYLISELMAARIVRVNCPQEKQSGVIKTVMQESPTAKNLREILISLKIKKPPPQITPKMLFSKLEARLKEILQKEGNILVGKPIYDKVLTKKDWKNVENTYKEMYEEFQLRREALIARFESERLQFKKDAPQSACRPKREAFKAKPNVKLSDFLAARTSLQGLKKTSSADVQKNKQNEVNKSGAGGDAGSGGGVGGGDIGQDTRDEEQARPPPSPPEFKPNLQSLQSYVIPPGVSSPSEAMAVGISSIGHMTPMRGAEGLSNPHDPAEVPKGNNSLTDASGYAVCAAERVYKRLSGAGKKRIRRWMELGKTFEEAKQLSYWPLAQFPDFSEILSEKPISSTAKRPHYDDCISSSSDTRPSKIPNTYPYPTSSIYPSPQLLNPIITAPPRHAIPNFQEDPDASPIGIEDLAGPMTEETIELLKQAILKLSDASSKGEGPSFLSWTTRAGMLLLTCADLRSQVWLTANVSNITPWQGARLRLTRQQLPKFKVGITWIPDQEADPPTVLRRLEVQNVGIDCSLWKVMSAKKNKFGQTITFHIDESSCETIEKRKNRLFLSFGTVLFKIKPINPPNH